MSEYVIASMRHTGSGDYAVTLWGPSDSGYTPNLDDAGKYGEEVVERFKDHLKDDFPIEYELAKRIAVEREYNYSGWKAGHFIINDEMFRNTFGLDKKCHYKSPSNKRYFRFAKEAAHE